MAILVATSKLSNNDFKRVMNFVRDLTVSFRVSPKETRVAMVIYDRKVRPVFRFEQYKNNGALYNKLKGLNSFPRSNGKPQTDEAISYAGKELFRKRGSRKGVLLVITGRPSKRVLNKG